MHLPPFPFVVLDTETTGFFPRADKILELACTRFENGEKVSEYESLYMIEQEIPAHVQVITRIRPEHLKEKPVFASERENVTAILQDAVIIGHNILFDLRMLKGEGVPTEGLPWVDTAALASLVFPEFQSFSLSYLSTVLHLPHEPKHRARGDVHATATLFEKIYERLQELPESLIRKVKDLAEKGPGGYGTFFSSLKAGGVGSPQWLKTRIKEQAAQPESFPVSLSAPQLSLPGEGEDPTLLLLNTPLFPRFLSSYLQHPSLATEGRKWVAVKNLRGARRTLPVALLDQCAFVYPPHALLSPSSKEQFLAQPAFTADELTLALKFVLYEPEREEDIPLHSEEHEVWDAKLACTSDAPSYQAQLKGMHGMILIDHHQLLDLTAQGKGPARGDQIIIDDASMLEDTATRAFRWFASLPILRAGAAGGEPMLTRLLDLWGIWLERVRQDLTIRYLVEADLRTPEVRGVRERIEEVLSRTLPQNIQKHLQDLRNMLDPKHLEGRITWIEQFRDGGLTLQSVPFDIASLLWDAVYDTFSTTLLLPPGGRELCPGIISPRMDVHMAEASMERSTPPSLRYAEQELTLERLLPRVDGKVIALIASKGLIEQYFVRFAERLEEAGITLIAQGLSGGLGRMQAEFAASEGPSVWLLTPWMYEGVELPPEMVDHLWIATLPFDHPSHAVLSRRAERYRKPFEEYFLPRLLHRLFRILRTYELHRKPDGDILLLDNRIRTKEYGRKVKEYLRLITSTPP